MNIRNVDALRSALVKYHKLTGAGGPRRWLDVAQALRNWDTSGRLGLPDDALAERLRRFANSETMPTPELLEAIAGFLLADGTVLVDEKESRKAKADGEDLLTPLIQKASEQIVAAAKK